MSGPLFDQLRAAMRDNALAEFRAIAGEPGEVLIEEGAQGGSALYLTSGRVAIEREGRVIDESGPGELIGEMSLFTGRAPVATIRALERTEGLLLDADGLYALHADRNIVAHRFERLALTGLARRLRRLDELIAQRAKGQSSPYLRPPASALDRIRSMFFGDKPPETVRARPRHPVELLYESPSFKHLDAEVRTSIAAEMKLQAVPPGTFLCTQGEPGEAMYLLAFGHVEVFVVLSGAPPKVHRLGEIADGTLFGLTALMDDRPRMASCVARDKVDVLVLPRERWKRLFNETTQASSALRQAVITAFADQVDEAGRNLVSIAPDDDPTVLLAAARLDHVGLQG